MRISVVIPTFNRAGMFRQTIETLANQKVRDFTYEVIFVSNGSTDSSDSILKEIVASDPTKFRYFRIEPTGGPSAPRNVGIRAATGDLVVILDDDVAPHSDLILRHAEFHQRYPQPHHAAVGRVYVPARLLSDPMSLFHAQYSYDGFKDLERLTYFDFWTCNVSFKRQFMLDHGMFDERILLMEDVEVAHRLERRGMHLHYLPLALGAHLHETNPDNLAARALLLGGSVYELTQYLPAPILKKRFGMISKELGLPWCMKRLLRLSAFLLLDNPLTRCILLLLGAKRSKRSRITDAYFGLVFRRAFLMGYYRARFTAWRQSTFVRTNHETRVARGN